MAMTTPPYLQIQNVTKAFGRFTALGNVSLEVARGEFVCILGPSGCGKTTLLRIVAGLEEQDAGSLIQDRRDISRLPPARRDFGIVFQSYALFPNLTAMENIAYGLRNGKPRADAVNAQVNKLLALVGLSEFAHKYPAQLSGGQQQRVALARALALEPGLLLLDEPLSALDARVRATLRGEITALQKRLGVTTLMVTHDQTEALTMADRIVVMNQGCIEQVGTPFQIYREPATPFVADFVGEMNFLSGTVCSERAVLCGPFALNVSHTAMPGSALTLAIRPEDIRVHQELRQSPDMALANVDAVEFLGAYYRLHLRVSANNHAPDLRLTAHLVHDAAHDVPACPNTTLPIQLPTHLVRVFEPR
jgi:iron(III) transport system ATP-binding protein